MKRRARKRKIRFGSGHARHITDLENALNDAQRVLRDLQLSKHGDCETGFKQVLVAQSITTEAREEFRHAGSPATHRGFLNEVDQQLRAARIRFQQFCVR